MRDDQQPASAGNGERPGLLRRVWRFITSPSAMLSVGVLSIGGFVAGIVFWGGFNWSMEMTNNEQFCIGCHEMADNVYAEYQGTVHQTNHSGVRATCPDCHVPKEWLHKVVRKIQATKELYGHFITHSIDTPEKFESERLRLASNVWTAMKTTDSRECRNCHNFEFMDFTKQENRAAKSHQTALDSGATCIDCHQGIAHKLPDGHEQRYKTIVDEIMAGTETDTNSDTLSAPLASRQSTQ